MAGVGFEEIGAGVGMKEHMTCARGDTTRSDTPRSGASTVNCDSISRKVYDDFEIEEASAQKPLQEGGFACDNLFKDAQMDSIKCHHRNALRHVSLQQYAAAKEEFQWVLELDSTNAPALSDLGVLYMIEQDLQMAEVCLTEALAYDPTHAGSRYNLGLLLQTQCEFERAKDQFKLCVDANPKHTTAMLSLAQILSFEGKETAAEELRERANLVSQMAQMGQ